MIVLEHDRAAVIQGRAVETMRQLLAPGSVSLVLTDPPYGKHTHEKLGAERRSDGYKVRDKLAFDALTHAEVDELSAEFVRVCPGWILVFTDDRSVDWWGTGIERAGGQWIRTGHWVKTNPMPQMTGDRPSVGTEPIVIAHGSGPLEWNGGGHAACWRGPRDASSEHPNQKPEWLIQALLGSFAPAGGLVLDPFLGSGTTAAVAMRRDRIVGEHTLETACPKCARKRAEEYAPPLPVELRVLGVELDPVWAWKSAERIRAALRALAA